MNYDERRGGSWNDPRERAERTFRDIETDHVHSLWTEHRETSARVLRRNAQSPADIEVVPRRVEAPSRCTVPELLAQYERILVVGGRGSGKTALIAHLATRTAAAWVSEPPQLVPFVISVALLSEPRLDEPTIARHSPLGGARLIHGALLEKRALVLIDGLDEAGQGVKALSESIEAFARAHPGNRMVVTTRPRRTGIPGYARVELPGFVTATLVPPNRTRVYAAHRFLWRRYPERRATLVATKVDTLLRDLAGEERPEESPLGSFDLRDRRVLFGAVATAMHQLRLVEIPVELLAESLQRRLRGVRRVDGRRLVLDRTDELDLDDEPDTDGEKMLTRDDGEGPVARGAAERAEPAGELVRDIEGLAERVVQEIRSSKGLLIEQRPGTFLFADLAYQDYLNAEEHVRRGALWELVENCDDGWWHDTVVFAAGAAGVDAAAFIQEILNTHSVETAVATLVAARCAEVAAGGLPPPLRRVISRRLSELVPPRNHFNVAHLIEVGQVVGPALLDALGTATPSERAHTTIVLDALCYEPACGALVRMAADPRFVEGSITYRIGTEDQWAKNRTVGYFALAALFNMTLASRAAMESFERALERVSPKELQRFHTLVERNYVLAPDFDADKPDRDPEIVDVLLAKMRKVLYRTASRPLPRIRR
jgi:hypothetical protein